MFPPTEIYKYISVDVPALTVNIFSAATNRTKTKQGRLVESSHQAIYLIEMSTDNQPIYCVKHPNFTTQFQKLIYLSHRHLSNIDCCLALFASLVLLMATAKKEALEDRR